MTITDRLEYLHELVEKSYNLSKYGRYTESNEIFSRAFMIAENMIKIYEPAVFTDSELQFLNSIIDNFNYAN